MNIFGFKRLNPDVILPTYGTPYSACFDLRYCPTNNFIKVYNDKNILSERLIPLKDVIIHPGERMMVPTGLAFQPEITEFTFNSYSIRVYSRSGFSLKNGVVLVNGVGIIDADYQQEVQILMMNSSSVPVTIKHQERIAQAEIVVNESIVLSEIQTIKPIGERSGGFGSTGSL